MAMMESFEKKLNLDNICLKIAPEILKLKNSGVNIITFLNNQLVGKLSDLSCFKTISLFEFYNNIPQKKDKDFLNNFPASELIDRNSGEVFIFSKTKKTNNITIYQLYSDELSSDLAKTVSSENIFCVLSGDQINITERLLFDSPKKFKSSSLWLIMRNANLTKHRILKPSFFKKTTLASSECFLLDDDSQCNVLYFYLSDDSKSSSGSVQSNTRVDLVGKNCCSEIGGISFLKGRTSVKNDITTKHYNSNCNSCEIVKGVYDHDSEGEFNSLVIVDRGGVNANTVQKNNNILLSSQASVNSNPQLEIFTDDVKCAHGSTTGQLDADAVFYLRSRGLSLSQANGLLLRGFLSEVVELSKGFEVHEELVENLKKLINV